MAEYKAKARGEKHTPLAAPHWPNTKILSFVVNGGSFDF
jgi:hypothetical protein